MLDLQAKPLRGKTALVTGAARRLGRASALALAQAGADVAITFRDSAREARETVIDLSGFGVRAFALRCDVTDEASVRAKLDYGSVPFTLRLMMFWVSDWHRESDWYTWTFQP